MLCHQAYRNSFPIRIDSACKESATVTAGAVDQRAEIARHRMSPPFRWHYTTGTEGNATNTPAGRIEGCGRKGGEGMETENRWPKVGHVIVDEVDGKPHIYIEYEYEEETPPTVEASAGL